MPVVPIPVGGRTGRPDPDLDGGARERLAGFRTHNTDQSPRSADLECPFRWEFGQRERVKSDAGAGDLHLKGSMFRAR